MLQAERRQGRGEVETDRIVRADTDISRRVIEARRIERMRRIETAYAVHNVRQFAVAQGQGDIASAPEAVFDSRFIDPGGHRLEGRVSGVQSRVQLPRRHEGVEVELADLPLNPKPDLIPGSRRPGQHAPRLHICQRLFSRHITCRGDRRGLHVDARLELQSRSGSPLDHAAGVRALFVHSGSRSGESGGIAVNGVARGRILEIVSAFGRQLGRQIRPEPLAEHAPDDGFRQPAVLLILLIALVSEIARQDMALPHLLDRGQLHARVGPQTSQIIERHFAVGMPLGIGKAAVIGRRSSGV